VLCRKRYADDQVRAALSAGIDQLVVLGAGLDTRAYRLADPQRVGAFEVDLPVDIDTKRSRVRAALGKLLDRVRLVPADLETGDLAQSLSTSGFPLGPTGDGRGEAVTNP
jgi:methyltransferase (TIGR00027 family)